MKPLVFWCRWHEARLQLAGRDETAVWGRLVFPETTSKFRFDLQTWQLTLDDEAGQRMLQLDEMGVEIQD